MQLHERDVLTDLGRLHLRVGGADTAAAIVFWPSLLLDGRMWFAQAEHFAPRYRVVLIDPPGHGLSARLPGSFDLDTCGTAVAQILDSLGIDRAHFVGCSWGAMAGVAFAAQRPERVGVAILLNATATPAARRERYAFEVLLTLARITGGRRALTSVSVDAFIGPTTRHSRPQVSELIRQSIAELDLPSVVHAMRSVLTRRQDQRTLLSRITTPTLVVAGGEDPTFSVAESAEIADGLADSELVVLPDAGHLVAVEVPDKVNKLIEKFIDVHG